MIDINKFLAGYIGAALWSTTDCRDEDGNDTYSSLEDEFSSVSANCKAAMLSDCEDFVGSNRENLEAFKSEADCDDYRLGFLFWLNRVGHGSGFWDECKPGSVGDELGEALSEASKPYGDFPLFGDFEDGVVKSHHYG